MRPSPPLRPANPWLHALDCALSLFLFFPSMLAYWRGIWDLLGVYIIPEQEPLCHWLTTGLGACALLNYFTLPLLDHWLSRDRRLTYFLVTRLHMVVMGLLNMAYWRGVSTLISFCLTHCCTFMQERLSPLLE